MRPSLELNWFNWIKPARYLQELRDAIAPTEGPDSTAPADSDTESDEEPIAQPVFLPTPDATPQTAPPLGTIDDILAAAAILATPQPPTPSADSGESVLPVDDRSVDSEGGRSPSVYVPQLAIRGRKRRGSYLPTRRSARQRRGGIKEESVSPGPLGRSPSYHVRSPTPGPSGVPHHTP